MADVNANKEKTSENNTAENVNPPSGADETGPLKDPPNSNHRSGSKSDEETGEENDFIKLNGFNLNNYASKKTLAQGLLDLALLSANAAQLKYILTIGDVHEFYNLLLWLIATSICLQVIQAVLCIIMALIFNLNNYDDQKAANIINNVSLVIIIVIVVVNVVLTGFDVKSSQAPETYCSRIRNTTSKQ